ncbi:hypothetical protein Q5424_12610 [Conexibacter sp. JD483]|uniref:hypothetical protein n=1 Tax=unclassified Conexibacter TaxID=2627773 RepID=UPI00271BFC40|nr:MULTISPECIES: hypothetical protein [unclassified Conexibacter]MDO8186891.1 hypothetical protein [Conexibacter sp. CPCC 205706]MDO8200797.1 hypothetical protein [Conexibacter sp. CPCC 205762]MDR9369933.1 hypothetical protein [Conexibacter sp. JD483]
MEFLLIVVVFALVVLVIATPLRRGRVEQSERREALELAELEAAKEAKYHEIRDAEMDFRTGKLSKEDHRILDRQLRGEAIQLLRRIDTIKPPAEAAAGGLGPGGRAAAEAAARAAPDDDPADGSEAPPREDSTSATMR